MFIFIFFENIIFTCAYFRSGPQIGAGDGHRVQEQGRVGGPQLMALNTLQISWIRFGPYVRIAYRLRI